MMKVIKLHDLCTNLFFHIEQRGNYLAGLLTPIVFNLNYEADRYVIA